MNTDADFVMVDRDAMETAKLMIKIRLHFFLNMCCIGKLHPDTRRYISSSHVLVVKVAHIKNAC